MAKFDPMGSPGLKKIPAEVWADNLHHYNISAHISSSTHEKCKKKNKFTSLSIFTFQTKIRLKSIYSDFQMLTKCLHNTKIYNVSLEKCTIINILNMIYK